MTKETQIQQAIQEESDRLLQNLGYAAPEMWRQKIIEAMENVASRVKESSDEEADYRTSG